MKEKTPLLDLCDFRKDQKYFIIFVRNYLHFKIYATSEGAVSHNVLYFSNCQMFYTINGSQMLVTKSVFKFIFVSSNYQTCTLPLSPKD